MSFFLGWATFSNTVGWKGCGLFNGYLMGSEHVLVSRSRHEGYISLQVTKSDHPPVLNAGSLRKVTWVALHKASSTTSKKSNCWNMKLPLTPGGLLNLSSLLQVFFFFSRFCPHLKFMVRAWKENERKHLHYTYGNMLYVIWLFIAVAAAG